MRAADVRIEAHPASVGIDQWEATADLGPIHVRSPIGYHRPGLALRSVLEQFVPLVCEHEVPELGLQLARLMWWWAPAMNDGFASDSVQVRTGFRFLDGVCRTCHKINRHPQRAIVITLLADVHDGVMLYGDDHEPPIPAVFEKAMLLAD